ncbi:sugar-specific transcriptional regulator TrmB [Streptomyces puniciscabiei]|uniref:Sugar-specific transcriptional regulator TrmB n=1 Tax=Streptomyces puniciscabiei TaxID=164348 RepID=A0A542UH99_9ACTN|nr:hypothetical protein [Streptomyces puniciscabiei]TQK98414.1 sugar-specific transcriptional regulator TrmB [Streptomyces puniciscabiei]
MSILGLSEMEERIYRHFLRNPGTTADDMHLLFRVALDDVQRALDRLCVGGALRESPPTGYLAAPPDIAVDKLTDLRLRELHEELRNLTQSRHLVSSLQAECEPKPVEASGIERLDRVRQIRDRIDDLAFFAREEILSVEPYSALTEDNIGHARPLDMRCLRRGVRIRSVILRKALDHPPTAGYLRELHSQGAEIRVAEEINERILVYDGRTALTPVDPANISRGALIAREAGLVANVVALFEKIWDSAVDLLAAAPTGEAEAPGLGDTEQRVLEAMCRGVKDEIGARDLGMSVRTYRRYVAELLQTLDAASRPQAALLARERGWV